MKSKAEEGGIEMSVYHRTGGSRNSRGYPQKPFEKFGEKRNREMRRQGKVIWVKRGLRGVTAG